MSDEPKKYIPISQVSDIFLMAWRENGDLTHAEYEAEMKRRYPPDGKAPKEQENK